jgi:small subunit ribosomal protein S24e
MQVEIASEKENPLLKRKEVRFKVEHSETGCTPPRLEIRKAIAATLKIGTDRVFVKRFKTKTGTHTAIGDAHIYDSIEQAKLIEPEYVVKRNIPPEKPKEEEKKE